MLYTTIHLSFVFDIEQKSKFNTIKDYVCNDTTMRDMIANDWAQLYCSGAIHALMDRLYTETLAQRPTSSLCCLPQLV